MALTVRSMLIGGVLSMVVAMYSAYAGLKIGGVYWPIITATIICMAILKLLGNTNINEINLAQTAANTGGMVAAGIVFTVPALALIGTPLTLFEIFSISLVGGLLGVFFTTPLRGQMIVREKLPYPDGAASAAVLKAGDEGGKKAKILVGAFGIGALFSVLRDKLALIPQGFNLDTLKLSSAKYFSFGSAFSLVAVSGGYLIGPLYSSAWFLGSIISYLILAPLLVYSGLFADKISAIFQFTKLLGIGTIIGSAVAYFLFKALPTLGTLFKARFSGRNPAIVFIIGILALSILTKMSLPVTVLAVLGAFAMAFVGARVTGEMNIDPMEVFAMAILLVAKLVFSSINPIAALTLAAVVCISAGIAGDLMQDLKAGYIVGTDYKEQVKAQIVGVFAASLVVGITILALDNAYGIGSDSLPAFQAVAFKQIVSQGFGGTAISIAGISINSFASGLLLGFLATLLCMRLNLGFLSMAFGIGLYAPIELGVPIFIGGLVRFFADKRSFHIDEGRIIAAGFIAGEGFLGVLLAIIPTIMALL